MTKIQRRKYLRKWRAKQRRRCECGNPGTVESHEGLICARCSRLEYLRDLRSTFAERKGYLFGGLPEHSLWTDGKTVVHQHE